MAYGVLYTASFKDRLQVKSFRVDILQENYVSGSTAITYMAVTPVVLKYHSEKGKEQYIQGSSLTFRFKSLVADNDKYDALFEGYEKEFKIKYYDITSGDVLIWEGYIQSDNLSRSFTDNIYEITLNATDWLSNLKEVEFRNGSTSYTGNVTVLSAIKTCLEFVGIELDFWVQLNTYETTYMTSTSQVLKLTYIDLARFTKTVSGKTKYTSVYDVLTYVIKSFNCTLKQVQGYYKIVNFYELSSFYYTFTWADFTASSRTASPGIEAIDSYTIKRDSNLTKLKPILRLDFKRNSRDIGGELVEDTNDFTGSGPWTISATDGSNRTVDDQITIIDSNPATSNHYIRVATPSQTATSSLYLKITFDIQFTTTPPLTPIDKVSFHVRITKPVSGQESIQRIIGDSLFHYESVIGDVFAIDETGVYTVEISPSDSANDYTSASIIISNVRINSVNMGSPEFDQNYIAYIDENAQVTPDEIFFSDTNTNTDQGGFKILDGSFIKTEAWDRYGETEDLSIHEIWALNVIKSRQFYKPLITINIIDDSFNLHADSIIELDSDNYKITEIETIYNKSIHKIIIEFIETVDPSYTFSSTPLTTINGESTETDSPTGSGTVHGNLDGLSADDHVQYYNEARGDARYSQLAAENTFTNQRNNFSGGAETTFLIGAKGSEADADSRILLNEGENGVPNSLDYGFSIAYSGSGEYGLSANEFAIIRHNNSAVGIPVIKIDRATGKVSIRYHKAIDTNGISFEISTGNEYWRMENDGDFHAEGDVIAFSTTVSDKRLKENIKPLKNALEKILKIKGVSFSYIKDSNTHIGILAQDLMEIIPELVIQKKLPIHKNDDKLYYVIRYTELIPYVIEAIKEQQKQIDKNTKDIEDLKMFNLRSWK